MANSGSEFQLPARLLVEAPSPSNAVRIAALRVGMVLLVTLVLVSALFAGACLMRLALYPGPAGSAMASAGGVAAFGVYSGSFVRWGPAMCRRFARAWSAVE